MGSLMRHRGLGRRLLSEFCTLEYIEARRQCHVGGCRVVPNELSAHARCLLLLGVGLARGKIGARRDEAEDLIKPKIHRL